ncbi:MAG: membrane protein insertase YidC [Paludibacteraceae bacterium]|nr:membrane protein insertase YidC [Paludibacteraceae bacterium]
MDKNTIIGFALILAILVGFSWLSRPSEEELAKQQAYNDSIAAVQAQKAMEQEILFQQTIMQQDSAKANQAFDYGVFTPFSQGENKKVVIENEELKLTLNTKGGNITEVELKNYKNYDKNALILFDEQDAEQYFTLVTANNRVVESSNLYFTPTMLNDSTLAMSITLETGETLSQVYSLDGFMVNYSIQSKGMNNVLSPRMNTVDMTWNLNMRQQERSKKFEGRYSALYYKYYDDEVECLSENGSDAEKLIGKVKWVACKDQFFSSVLIAEDYFTNVEVESNISEPVNYLKDCKTQLSFNYDASGAQPTNLKFYFGPNSYQDLQAYDDGVKKSEDRLDLEELVPLGWGIFGWVNKYLVIPIFNLLGSFITNYGLIIFLLTLIIKLLILPLTYKSYMSTAKMRVLRPQIEEINKRIPEDKPMERQQATMALYRKVGVSPMGGCLPMLLQMPILFALFVFFPVAIELRQQGFLWADDLSSYDSIFSWDVYIPFISSYYGNHISLFCLLMAIANIISTKISTDAQGASSQQMPAMKWMMYLMPIMFLFFFNDYACGLTYYYLVSTLLTLLQTFIFRVSINDQKILAKLNSYQAKPKKKSGFMERLEKMQKEQLARQREEMKKQQRRR